VIAGQPDSCVAGGTSLTSSLLLLGVGHGPGPFLAGLGACTTRAASCLGSSPPPPTHPHRQLLVEVGVGDGGASKVVTVRSPLVLRNLLARPVQVCLRSPNRKTAVAVAEARRPHASRRQEATRAHACLHSLIRDTSARAARQHSCHTPHAMMLRASGCSGPRQRRRDAPG
jgi:hypothetical protein